MTNNGDPAKSSSKPRRTRRRTLLGCLTCRLRHVKCTLEQPACRNCVRLNLHCAGYSGKLKWLNHGTVNGKSVALKDENEADGERGAGRREIFSVAERKQMSQSMTECFGNPNDEDLNKCLNEALENLEVDTDTPDQFENTLGETTQLSGPFGVFNSRASTTWNPQFTPGASSSSRGNMGAPERIHDEIIIRGPGSASLARGNDPSLSANTGMATYGTGTDSIFDGTASTAGTEPTSSIADTEPVWRTPVSHDASVFRDNAMHRGSISASYSSVAGDTPKSQSIPSDATFETNMAIRRPSRTQSAYTPRSGHSVSTPSEAPWEDIFITIDQLTSSEICSILGHFRTHLSHLLSPLPLPEYADANVRSKTCLDRALLCFGKLTVFSESSVDACAVLYSLLAMSSAHLNAVYIGLEGFNTQDRVISTNNTGTQDKDDWHTSAMKYAKLTQQAVDNSLKKQKHFSKTEHKNVLVALLNMILSMTIADIYQPSSVMISRCIGFISRIPPRHLGSEPKSKTVLAFEFSLLQECVMEAALSVLIPTSTSYGALEHLSKSKIWEQFLALEKDPKKPAGPAERAGGPEGCITASQLRSMTGSPVPPSLLWLILENALFAQKLKAGTQNNRVRGIAALEHTICTWVIEDDLADVMEASHMESNSDNESDSESSDTEVGSKDAAKSALHATAGPLTQAHHTSLLLLFFSSTKPTNLMLLDPLRRKLLKQLRSYVKEVDEADLDVGVGAGILWPLKVLEGIGLGGKDKREMKPLWDLVKGGGLRT